MLKECTFKPSINKIRKAISPFRVEESQGNREIVSVDLYEDSALEQTSRS